MTEYEANDEDLTPSAVKQTNIQPRLLPRSPENTSPTKESASVEEHHQFSTNSTWNDECIRAKNWGLPFSRNRLHHGDENSNTNVTNHGVLPGLALAKTSTTDPHCDSRQMSTTTELVEFFPKPVVLERTARQKQISDDRFCQDAYKYCDIWNISRGSPCFQTSNSGKYPSMWRPSKLECGTEEDEESENSTSSCSNLGQTPQEQSISPVSHRLSLQEAKELVAEVPGVRSYLSSTSVVFPNESGERNDAILMASESIKPKRKCSSALYASKRFYTTGDSVVGLQPFLYVGVVVNSERSKKDTVNPKDNSLHDPQKGSSTQRASPSSDFVPLSSTSRGDRISIKPPWNFSTKYERRAPPRYEHTPYVKPDPDYMRERASETGWDFSPKIARNDPPSLRSSFRDDEWALDPQDPEESGGVKRWDTPFMLPELSPSSNDAWTMENRRRSNNPTSQWNLDQRSSRKYSNSPRVSLEYMDPENLNKSSGPVSSEGWNTLPRLSAVDPSLLRPIHSSNFEYESTPRSSNKYRTSLRSEKSDTAKLKTTDQDQGGSLDEHNLSGGAVNDQNIPDRPPKISDQEPNNATDPQWHTNYNSRKSRTRKAVKAEVAIEEEHGILGPATTNYTEYTVPEIKQIPEIYDATVESLSAQYDLDKQRLSGISADVPAHENNQIPTEDDQVVQKPGVQMGSGELRLTPMQISERVDVPYEIQSILNLPPEDELIEHPVTEESRKLLQIERSENVPDSVVDPSKPQTAPIELKTVPGRLAETAQTSTEPGSKKSSESAYHSDALSQKVRESIKVKQDDVIVRELPPENVPATPHAPMTSVSEAVQVPEDTDPMLATIIPLEDLATYPISLPASVTSYLKPNRKTTLIVTQNDNLVQEIKKRPNTISGIPSVLPEAVKQPINYGPSYSGISSGGMFQYVSMATTPMFSEISSNSSYSVARRTSARIMLSMEGKVPSTSSEDLRHSPAVLSQPVEFKPVSTKLSSFKDIQPADKPATIASEGILIRPTDSIISVSIGIGHAQGPGTRSLGNGVIVTTVPSDPHTPLDSRPLPNLTISSPAVQAVPTQMNKPHVSAVSSVSMLKEPVDSPHSETVRTENEHFPLPMTTSPTPPPVLDPTVDQVESYADSEYASEAPPAAVDTDLSGLQSPLNQALVHNTKPIPIESRPNQLNYVSNMHIRPSREPNNYIYAQAFQNQQAFGPHYSTHMPGVDQSFPHSVPVHSTITNQPLPGDAGAAGIPGQMAKLPTEGGSQGLPRSLQTRKTREQVNRRITWDWKRDFVPAADEGGIKTGQEIGSMEMKDAYEIVKETSLLTEGFRPPFSLGEHPSVLISLPNDPGLSCEMKVGNFTEIRTTSNTESPGPRGAECPDLSESSGKKGRCMSFRKKSRRKSAT
ncbi:unnamed protein product [Calicophoron daubneyi]|uniref:Uncharacterized protein n=1 Tax=Calicophoron daubneyi TaxID=300641 RepID=A0AAV2TTU8_CALDB